MVACLGSILLSASRSALVATLMGVGYVFFMYFRHAPKKLFRALLALFFLGILLVPFVQHFGVHTIVEDVFGLVERFFPDRGHLGNGVAIFRADFGNAVMAKLILPVGEPDPYVRVASAMRQEGAQRLAYPVGEARCFPVHGFRDAEALNGLKDRCASSAALYKADPALADINTHNRALFAEPKDGGARPEESGGVGRKKRKRRLSGVYCGYDPAASVWHWPGLRIKTR